MKAVWLAAGHLSLLVGIIGIAVPLLPTTPFLILAAFFYSRGSTAFEVWLLTHPHLGPSVRAWRENGAISPRAKCLAIFMVSISAASLFWFESIPWWGQSAASLILMLVGAFILTRPSGMAKTKNSSPQR